MYRPQSQARAAGQFIGMIMASFGLAACLAPTLWAQAPPGFYNSVDDMNATTLRQTLHAVIDDHTRYPYTSTATDTWDILEQADEDPNNANNILDVYKNASYPKQGGGNSFYDREHTWPSSYGFPNDNAQNYPYTDCHMLHLCDGTYNQSRSNHPYRDCNASCAERPTDVNNGQGGGSGTYPGNSNWDQGSLTQGTWEAWFGKRGDVARAMFYMDLRYEGGLHGVTGASEPDLILTDSESLIAASNTGSNESVAYMGMLTDLLLWHLDDPVDDDERARNDVVFGFQANRNPFVDHPEWVDCLYNDNCGCIVDADCDDLQFCNGVESCVGGSCLAGSDPCPGQGCDEAGDTCTVLPTGDPWINDLHYDNISTDAGEFVEIAGPAGLDLSGWQVLGYNGSGGATYGTTANLSGVIPDQGGCMGTLAFDFIPMQNGSPDGLALIDEGGVVIQFISYEGSFTATNGPALGMVSEDIGVVESNSTTPVGNSLQLSGTGAQASNFTWQPDAPQTRGLPNTGQTFDGCGGCSSDPECDDGLYCNGAETCVTGSCQPGTAPNCNDGVGCTDDFCNETTDACDNTPNDANCDNGLFCDGAETCDPTLDCQAGVDPCAGQGCDEVINLCTTCNNDGICDPGEDCSNCSNDCFAGSGAVCGNGICETADGEDCLSCDLDCNGKLNGNPNNRYCCGDGTAEYGVTCADGRCTADGNTCSEVSAPGSCCGDDICEGSEDEVNCAVDCACFSSEECADADMCTIDTCFEGVCFNDPVDCDDGDACTTDACDPGTGFCFNDPVSCDDQDACSVDSCDPVLGCENIFPSCGLSDGCCGPDCTPASDPDCCLAGGQSCSSNAECCSNKCKGGTCRGN